MTPIPSGAEAPILVLGVMYGLKPVPCKDAEIGPSPGLAEIGPSPGLFEEFGEAVEVLAEFREFAGEDGDFGF